MIWHTLESLPVIKTLFFACAEHAEADTASSQTAYLEVGSVWYKNA